MNNQAYLPTIVNYPQDQKYPEDNLPQDDSILKKRSYAFAIDILFIVIINKGLMYTYISFLKNFFYQLTISSQLVLEENMTNVFSVSLFIVFWGYFFMSYYWAEGKTPGKQLFGLKVHSPNFKYTGEYRLSVMECFARTMGHLITCLFYGLFLVIPFITKSKKGIPDWISQTTIVTDEQMKHINDIYFSPQFEVIEAVLEKDKIFHDKNQLSLFESDQINELESDGTIIQLPVTQDQDDSEAA
jgi:uncharacterized RDD family membrane protein YckC